MAAFQPPSLLTEEHIPPLHPTYPLDQRRTSMPAFSTSFIDPKWIVESAAMTQGVGPIRRASVDSTAQGPHSCHICQRSFKRSNGLLRHIRTHTGEKPYQCTQCNSAFTRTDLLARHVVVHHGESSTNPTRNNSPETHQRVESSTASSFGPHDRTQSASSLGSLFQEGFSFTTTASSPSTSASAESSVAPEHKQCQSLSTAAAPTDASAEGAEAPMAMNDILELLNVSQQTAQQDQYPPSTLSCSAPASTCHSPFMAQGFAQQSSVLTVQAPQPSTSRHYLELYVANFSMHVPCIHGTSLEALKCAMTDSSSFGLPASEADQDLLLAMSIVGASYDATNGPQGETPEISPEQLFANGMPETQDGAKAPTPFNFYDGASLRDRLLSSTVQLTQCPNTSVGDGGRGLVRRAQAMILLHLVTLFNKNSRDQALMLHGPLVTVARELLAVHRARRAAKAAYEPHFGVTWQSWVQDEERLRTLWMIYVCDMLRAFIWQVPPWLALSEMTDLEGPCDEAQWEASHQFAWREARSPSSSRRGSSASGIELASSMPLQQQSIFEGRASLFAPHDSADRPWIPGPALLNFGLFGKFLLLGALCADIAEVARTDLAARQQLLSQFGAWPDVAGNTMGPDNTSYLALQMLNVELEQRLDKLDVALARWLKALSLASDGTHKLAGSNGASAFVLEPMSWFWSITHFMLQLRQRTNSHNPAQRRPSTSRSGGATPALSSSATFSSATNVAQVNLTFESFSIQPPMPSGPDQLMALMVHIKTALRKIDGGASVLRTLGSHQPSDIDGFCPPDSTARGSWFLDFFPKLTRH